MSYRGQRLLKPVFDPRTQPGYQSRFAHRPFDDFFGTAQWPLIGNAEPVNQPIADQNPEQKFRSLQSPNVAPARKK